MTLEDIATEVRGCQRCHLSQTRILSVPGQGPSQASIMLIGEAPGEKEDHSGVPFAGAAGRVLDDVLAFAGFERTEVFITSVIKCRPPKNRNPNRDEVEACRYFLERQMDLIDPKVICIMGNVALQAYVDPHENIGRVRGKLLEHNGKVFFPIYHPAAILYNRSLEQTLKADLSWLRSFLETSVVSG
jgi:DNA polymerase